MGERGKVVSHIYNTHLPLDVSPFYCTLCTFRCTKIEQLELHVTAYREHVSRVRLAEERGEETDERSYLKESTCPYEVVEGVDMERLSIGESNSVWKKRSGHRCKNDTNVIVSSTPEPRPERATDPPAPATIVSSAPEPFPMVLSAPVPEPVVETAHVDLSDAAPVEIVPLDLSFWSLFEHTEPTTEKAKERSRSPSVGSTSSTSCSCEKQVIRLTESALEIIKNSNDQMKMFAEVVGQLKDAIKEQTELMREEREARREKERRESEREERELRRERERHESEKKKRDSRERDSMTGVRDQNGRRENTKENRERSSDERRNWRHERPQRM